MLKSFLTIFNLQVNDGYFVHFFAPQSLTPLSKYVTFVLDTSGSMGGRKIEQLRAAMRAILADLKPNDYFSIVEFDSDVKVNKILNKLFLIHIYLSTYKLIVQL